MYFHSPYCISLSYSSKFNANMFHKAWHKSILSQSLSFGSLITRHCDLSTSDSWRDQNKWYGESASIQRNVSFHPLLVWGNFKHFRCGKLSEKTRWFYTLVSIFVLASNAAIYVKACWFALKWLQDYKSKKKISGVDLYNLEIQKTIQRRRSRLGLGVRDRTLLHNSTLNFFILCKHTFIPKMLSLIHIWRCRRYSLCRSRWSPYH